MGHRANFVLIQQGSARAYHDQWAALGSTWAFAAGPDEAVPAAELGSPTTELLDWAFAEAGYLLDFDECEAIVFGYPEFSDDFDPSALAGIEGIEGLEGLASIDPLKQSEIAQVKAALQQGPLEFLRSIAPRWKGWLLRWDDRGVEAFADHLARRGITTIATQPRSDRGDRTTVSLQA
jgi:hypothetical protein